MPGVPARTGQERRGAAGVSTPYMQHAHSLTLIQSPRTDHPEPFGRGRLSLQVILLERNILTIDMDPKRSYLDLRSSVVGAMGVWVRLSTRKRRLREILREMFDVHF